MRKYGFKIVACLLVGLMLFSLSGCAKRTHNGVKVDPNGETEDFLLSAAANTVLEYLPKALKTAYNWIPKIKNGVGAEVTVSQPSGVLTVLGENRFSAYLSADDGVLGLNFQPSAQNAVQMYLSGKEVGISFDFGNDADASGAYGFELDDVVEKLENSPFAPNSGSLFALSEAMFDSFADPIKGLQSLIGGTKEVSLYDAIADMRALCSISCFAETVENEDGSYAVQFTAEGESAATLLKDLAKRVEKTPLARILLRAFGVDASDLISEAKAYCGDWLENDSLTADFHITKQYVIDNITVRTNRDVITLDIQPMNDGVKAYWSQNGDEIGVFSLTEADGLMDITWQKAGEKVFSFRWAADSTNEFRLSAGNKVIDGIWVLTKTGFDFEIVSIKVDGEKRSETLLGTFTVNPDDAKKVKPFAYENLLEPDAELMLKLQSTLVGLLSGEMQSTEEPDTASVVSTAQKETASANKPSTDTPQGSSNAQTQSTVSQQAQAQENEPSDVPSETPSNPSSQAPTESHSETQADSWLANLITSRAQEISSKAAASQATTSRTTTSQTVSHATSSQATASQGTASATTSSKTASAFSWPYSNLPKPPFANYSEKVEESAFTTYYVFEPVSESDVKAYAETLLDAGFDISWEDDADFKVYMTATNGTYTMAVATNSDYTTVYVVDLSML